MGSGAPAAREGGSGAPSLATPGQTTAAAQGVAGWGRWEEPFFVSSIGYFLNTILIIKVSGNPVCEALGDMGPIRSFALGPNREAKRAAAGQAKRKAAGQAGRLARTVNRVKVRIMGPGVANTLPGTQRSTEQRNS